ncbi:MAG: TonB-dependent receptor [Novosphingobium sp.]|nr:TonB-dependent receptor [Novosphingobium sp.]
MRIFGKTTGLAGVSVFALCVAFPASVRAEEAADAAAQATAGQDRAVASGTGDIVVTARRREESLQNVPIAITALDSEALQKGAVRQTADLQFITPGLTFTMGSDSRQNSAFNIRGAGQAFGGNLPSVLTYFADVPLDYHGAASFAVFDLENVQVARGPQGTLFGRNTTSGAVVFVPRAPQDTLGGYVTGEIGNYRLRHFQAALNLPITDNLALRLSGDFVHRRGTTLNLTTGNYLDGRNQTAVRAFARWEPAAGIRNDTIVQYLYADETGTPYILKDVRPDGDTAATRSSMDKALYDLYGGPTGTAQYLAAQKARGPRVTALNRDTAEKRKIAVAVNTTTIELSDGITLKNILGYEWVRTNYFTDIDGTPQQVNYSSAMFGVPEFETSQWTDEIQLIGKGLGGRLDWIAGFFFLDSKSPASGFQMGRISESNLSFVGDGVPGPSVISTSRNSALIHDTSRALYAQATYDIGSGIKLTGGFRYSWDSRASTTGQMSSLAGINGPYTCSAIKSDGTRLPATTPEAQCFTTIKAKFDDYGYTIGAEWKPGADTLLYATTRRNFKDGGQNFINTLDTALLTYKPEIATDYEIGIKQSWLSGGLRGHTNLSLYYGKYDDMQRQVTVNTGTAVATVIYNAAKANIKGAEFETSFSLDNLTLSLFYNYTDAKYDNFIDPATGADLSANWLVGTPRHAGGGSLTYKADLGEMGSLEPSVSFYASGKFATAANQVVNVGTLVPGYHIVNARLDWREVGGLPLDLGVYVNNLADKDYIVAGLGLYGSTLGYNSVVYGQPRTYGLSLTWRFGE